jgi:lipid-binding SYLF domain-containing protein
MVQNRLATIAVTAMLSSFGAAVTAPQPAAGATARQIQSEAEPSLTRLYNQNSVAREYAREAKGILVFPEITKAGIGVGGSYGEGVLLIHSTPAAYYSAAAGSIGVTLGAQSFSQVILFMTEDALQQFQAREGWEAGVDGSVVAIDRGYAAGTGTLRGQEPVVGFNFDQQGLMFDASFSGMKYTKIRR